MACVVGDSPGMPSMRGFVITYSTASTVMGDVGLLETV